MGALLDSTYLINSERRGLTVMSSLQQARLLVSDGLLGLSVLSVMEMAHGESRADSPIRAASREQSLTDLMASLDVHPVTPSIARRAGRLDGELMKQGNPIAFADLLIGVTALELGYSVITRNLRHFNRIPGLNVIAHT